MKNRMIVAILAAMFCLSGCALTQYEAIKTENYPNTKKIFDINFGWKKSLTPGGVTLEGYAKNIRYPIVNDLELRVELLDKARKVKARAVYYFVPVTLFLDQSALFAVTVPATPQTGDVLRFNYRYQAAEDRDEEFTWMDSFEIPAVE